MSEKKTAMGSLKVAITEKVAGCGDPEDQEAPASPLLGPDQGVSYFNCNDPGEDQSPFTPITQKQSNCSKLWKNLWCRYGTIIVATAATAATAAFVSLLVWNLMKPGCKICPNKWTRYNEACYFQSENSSDWKSANGYCKDEGGFLLILDDSDQIVNYLKHHVQPSDFWIGLNKTGEWKWLNGTIYSRTVKHGDRSGMDCAYIDASNLDTDNIGALACSTLRRWLCMKHI